MSKGIFYFEGVNFGATMFDTSDISTIRGASRAYEDIVTVFASDLGDAVIAAGGSKLLVRTDLDAATLFDRLRAKLPAPLRDVLPHLSFKMAVAETEEAANAWANGRQFRDWTVPEVSGASKRPCSLDRRRPGHECPDGTVRSHSVEARRAYGRSQRSRQYASLIDATFAGDLGFASHFSDLVASPPPEVPESVRAKLAVIHADGAGFGDARAALVDRDPVGGAATFARELRTLQSGFVQKLVDWLVASGRHGVLYETSGERKLRLETLLFGGDDMDFVLPAWMALEFVERFHGWTKDWAIGGLPLSHRLAVIVGHHKTPIRQMRDLAHEGVDLLRQSGRTNVFSVDVFESAAPPADGLSNHRQRLIGPSAADAVFAWEMAQSAEMRDNLWAFAEDDGEGRLPRSQIHALLRGEGDLCAEDAALRVSERHESYGQRVLGREEPPPRLAGLSENVPLAARLAIIALLWDYRGRSQ